MNNQDQIKYKSFKNIIEIIETGNIHDPRYRLIIEGLEVDQVIEMQKFVRAMEYNKEVEKKLYETLN